MQLRKKDDDPEERTSGRRLYREMLEKQWKAESMNSREQLLLNRQLQLLTKQQRVVTNAIEKEKQLLLKSLGKKGLDTSVFSPRQDKSRRGLRPAQSLPCLLDREQCNRTGLTRKTSNVHVRELPPLHPSLCLKSTSQRLTLQTTSMPCVHEESGTNYGDSHIDITALPVDTTRSRSLTPPLRRSMAFESAAANTVEALTSPLAARRIKTAPKANAVREAIGEDTILPQLTVLN